MNIKPFLTLASERLAGTPTCCEKKPRAPAEAESTSRRRSQEFPSRREIKYPAQDSIQPKIVFSPRLKD